MRLFKGKRTAENLVLSEKWRAAELPSPGLGLEKFSPQGYTANDPEKLGNFYNACTEKLSGLLSATDEFTDPSVADAAIDTQADHLCQLHHAEKARHREQCARIRAAQQTRIGSLETREAHLREEEKALVTEIEPLAGLRAKHEITLFGRSISTGLLATIAFSLIDAGLNFAFLQNILLENFVLLVLIVGAMSILSDFTMYTLGALTSRKEEYISENKLLYKAACGAMLFFFGLSFAATLLIRLGSMDQTYGNVAADGSFVHGSYGLAEYSLQILTGFLTAGTGILSFVLSNDPNAHKVKLRRKLECDLLRVRQMLEVTAGELSTLRQVQDPIELDDDLDAAAQANIEVLRIGLKQHMRKLLAERTAKPEATDRIALSAQELCAPRNPQPALYVLKNNR